MTINQRFELIGRMLKAKLWASVPQGSGGDMPLLTRLIGFDIQFPSIGAVNRPLVLKSLNIKGTVSEREYLMQHIISSKISHKQLTEKTIR